MFLRFYALGSNPPSVNWDEASTGYNAYSILKTGKDEYGNFLPLSIRSFDDFKPPLYTYLTVPFVGIFGLSDFSVRLPSAILGTLTIIFIFLLVLELFPKDKNRDMVALAAAFLFAISPWSLQFSRAAYEGNIGLFFLIGGLLFFLKFLQKQWYILPSSLFFVLSMYSYHSFRLIVPLLLLVTAILFLKQLWAAQKIVIPTLLVCIILVIPIYSSFLTSSNGTGSRLSMVTLFGPSPNLDSSIKQLQLDKNNNDYLGEVLHNRRFVYFLAVTKGYLDHYNPDFLFLHGDGGRQHHAVDMGMLYLFELPLILLGFLVLCKNLSRRIVLFFAFLLIAPLASAITTGTPHPVRAIAMLPGFIVLSASGLVFLTEAILRVRNKLLGIRCKYILLAALCFAIIVNMAYYFHQYYVHTPVEYGDFWQYGNKDALEYAKAHENEVDKIVMTYAYDQPYIYYLYYNKIDPAWYQNNWNFTGNGQMPRFERKIGKYEFRNINWGEDQKLENTLFIGTPDELPGGDSVHTIKFLDGSTAYVIKKT